MAADTVIAHAIVSERVVLGDGVRPAAVLVDDDGRIVDIVAPSRLAPALVGVADRVHDFGDALVMPGLVDAHVHINEPGRTEWEGFETATRAAASGGVTTLVDMPLNSSPVTTTPEAFDAKLAAARAAALHVDVGFHGGVVPANATRPEVLEALAGRGVLGMKAFLVHSGIDEFPNATQADLDAAMPVLTELGLPLLVHSELDLEREAPSGGDPTRYATWLSSRPPAMEEAAIEMLLELCEAHGTHLHIVHLATDGALEMLADARSRGLPVTVETCPQYLTLAAEDVPDGATAFKCAPPIRGRAVQDALWEALSDGRIDMVVTDHSPAPPSIKHLDDGDFMAAWGGISSLGLALSLIWTEARRRGLEGSDDARIARLVEWMSAAPARLVGLSERKGQLAPGHDADLVVFDPDATWTIEPASLEYRHRISPYLGREVRGRVLETWLRGERVWSAEGAGAARGRVLRGRG